MVVSQDDSLSRLERDQRTCYEIQLLRGRCRGLRNEIAMADYI